MYKRGNLKEEVSRQNSVVSDHFHCFYSSIMYILLQLGLIGGDAGDGGHPVVVVGYCYERSTATVWPPATFDTCMYI